LIALIQRVAEARVSVHGEAVGAIGRGLLALVGVERGDTEREAGRLAERVLGYRVFADGEGKMNRSLADISGGLLLVPQFTLAADTRSGTRPGFSTAAAPDEGRRLFDCLVRLAREHHEFLFGASIHPYRRDALEVLDRVAEEGAVLVKWIPSVHAISLDDRRCRAFYRRLAHHRIPLLLHVGEERSVQVVGQDYGDPAALVAPLEEGVTVIAAHVASLGERDGRSNFDRLADLFPRWPNLYADTAALTLYTRWRVLLRLAERTDLHARLVHGSDFPLPPTATLFAGRIAASRWWDAWKRENGLRRDFEIKQGLGLPAQIYTRGYEVLGDRVRAA